MTRWIFALFLVVAMQTPWIAVEAAEKPSNMDGNGAALLEFNGKPDKHGLIVVLGIPAAPAFDWPFAVYNAGKKPVKNVRLKIQEKYEGKKIPFNDKAWVYPSVIEPGEFGFGGASLVVGGQQVVAGPAGGLDAKFSISTSINSKDDRLVDLHVRNAKSDDSGEVSGTVSNLSKFDVKGIEVHRLCIEDDGIMTSYFSQIDQRRLLEAGDSAEFKVSMNPCEKGNGFLVASIALKA
ncbi:MAG: hypothetical protein ACJ789_05635 [Thermomicrobiales bacterium]